MKPIKLNPTFQNYLWGGTRLVEEYGKVTDLRPVAESWEFSVHPDSPSYVAEGEFTGQTLASLFASHPEFLGDTKEFPILIKYIDALEPLSLQVHPNNEYALTHENQLGKNEMWYVLDALPGAEIVAGFNSPLTSSEIENAILQNTIMDYVNRIPIKAGDCFEIPAGLVHGIGAGSLIAEVQQNSNITYRIYDYDRRGADGKPRQLHIKQGVDVIKSSLQPVNLGSNPSLSEAGYSLQTLTDWQWFTAEKLSVTSSFSGDVSSHSYKALLIIDGEGSLICEDANIHIKKGDSYLLPANMGEYTINGSLQVLITSLPNNKS